MEINYDMIIKYLSSKNETYHFESQKNIMCFSDKFPSEFRELLGDKFYRIGVTQKIGEQKISFFSSLLTLLVDNYVTLNINEENTQINKLISELGEYLHKNIPKSLEDVPKGSLKKYIKEKEDCIWTLEVLVHKFDINILIFDFKMKSIYTIFPSDIINPWKPFLLFGKYDNNWEPIRNNDKSNFCYNDNVIKKILHTQLNIKYYDGNIVKKDYILVDNINEIMNIEFNSKDCSSVISEETEISEDNTTESENKTFIKSNVDIKINKSKLEKMKKDEIVNYIKSLNINVSINSKTTKKQLLELID